MVLKLVHDIARRGSNRNSAIRREVGKDQFAGFLLEVGLALPSGPSVVGVGVNKGREVLHARVGRGARKGPHVIGQEAGLQRFQLGVWVSLVKGGDSYRMLPAVGQAFQGIVVVVGRRVSGKVQGFRQGDVGEARFVEEAVAGQVVFGGTDKIFGEVLAAFHIKAQTA